MNDGTTEATMALTMAYLLFYTAEDQALVSGVLAVVTYGLCFTWFGKSRLSPGTSSTTQSFLSAIVFISETVIFVLCGAILWVRVDGRSIQPQRRRPARSCQFLRCRCTPDDGDCSL